MSDMFKALIGSVNIAARIEGFSYISCGLPMCDDEGVEWAEMSPEARWCLCLSHLRERDSHFNELFDEYDKQDAVECILFGNNTAIRLINAVQDECHADVMQLVQVLKFSDIEREITWLCNQKDALWDTLFDHKLIITEKPR